MAINLDHQLNKVNTSTSDINFDITGSLKLPVGTTAQRTGTLAGGELRFNSTNNLFEGYDGTDWLSLGALEDNVISSLSDVDTTGITAGQILEWNGTAFVPGTIVGEKIQWVTSGSNNELRVSEQWLETGTTYTVRSVAINSDNKLEVELASFSPTVSASGQSRSWDQPATQFSVTVDNPTDFTDRYISTVDSISSATGVHTTLANYTTSGPSQTPAGGIDWTQTFTTNATATIYSNGSGLTGGSASATIGFADNQSATWTDTDGISYSWQNANVTANFSNLNGKNFLETYTTVNYTINITGLDDNNNAASTVTPTGGTVSNASGSGTLTFTDAIHKDNNTGRSVDVSTVFTRPVGVTGSSYTVTDTASDSSINANFTYPSFYVWTADTSTLPTNADIVDGNDFHADATELGNQANSIQTTIDNTVNTPRAFWFGVRTTVSQPTVFQTGPSSALLSDTNVTTGNTISLEPTVVPGGYTGENYTLYGITLQPGQTYVRIV